MKAHIRTNDFEEDDSDKLYEQAKDLLSGDPEKEDIFKAIDLLKAAIEKDGHIGAKSFLAEIYLQYIKDIPKKEEKDAVKWLKEAAEAGDVEAQHNLGAYYMLGEHVEENEQEALKWLEKAAMQGDAEAQFTLGIWHREKYYTENDQETAKAAFDWIKLSAEQGIVEAKCQLGIFYFNAIGTAKNPKEAYRWTEEAAKEGNAVAQLHLGLLYNDGSGDLEENEEEAEKWFRRAADQGNADSLCQLGDMLEKRGGAENEKEAASLFCKAAEQGHAEALFRVGCCFEHGNGIEQSDEKAITYYAAAKEIGHKKAENHLNGLLRHNQINKEQSQEIERLVKRNKELEEDKRTLSDLININKKLDLLLSAQQEQTAVLNRVDKTTTETSGDVKQILGIVKKIAGEISDLKKEYKGKFNKDDPNDPAMIEFFKLAADIVKNHFKDKMAQETVNSASETLSRRFGSTWDKLTEDSKISLISSWSMWEVFKNAEGFDFSGVVICATSALEGELSKLMFSDFKTYMDKFESSDPVFQNVDYTDFMEKRLEKFFPLRPDRLAAAQAQGAANTERHFTLGNLRYIFTGDMKIGRNYLLGDPAAAKAHLVQERTDRINCFTALRNDYLRSVMKPNILAAYPQCASYTDLFTKTMPSIENEPKDEPENGDRIGKPKYPKDAAFPDDFENNSLMAKIEYIKNNFRNNAAHTDQIPAENAEGCCNVIFGRGVEQKMEEIHSILIQIFDLLK